MSDLVERLRSDYGGRLGLLAERAAHHIECIEAELAALRSRVGLEGAEDGIDYNPEIPGDLPAKVESYNQMHAIALDLGYPSILEALEGLSQPSPDNTAPLVEALRNSLLIARCRTDLTDNEKEMLDDCDSALAAHRSNNGAAT